ncbi:MAG: DUF3857 domain-containing protein [bacterium]
MHLLTKTLLLVWLVQLLAFADGSSLKAQPGWARDALDSAGTFTFDSDAPALVLHRSFETKISGSGKSRSKVRLATLILKSTGEEYGSLFETVTSDREILNVKGWRLRADGKKDKLKAEQIIYLDANFEAGYYSDARNLVASFGDIRAGDLIAYEYEISKTSTPYSCYEDFLLQKTLPVLCAQVRIEKPNDWGLKLSEHNLEPVDFDSADGEFVWEARRLESRPDEPLMPPWRYLVRHLEVSVHPLDPSSDKSFANWREVGAWARDLSETAAVSTPALATLASDLVHDRQSRFDTMAVIAEYVRDRVRYVAVEIEEGRFAPRAATTTHSLGYGDCKDKVTLMRALLREVQIQSVPVLANVGGLVDSLLPSPYQFNHVVIAMPLAEFHGSENPHVSAIDGWVYFDPTDAENRFGELGRSLQGRTVLRCSAESEELVRIPQPDPDDRRRCIDAEVTLRTDYSLSADVRVTDYLLWACNSRDEFGHLLPQKGCERRQEILAHFLSSPTVRDYRFEDYGDSCVTHYVLEVASYALQAADLTLLAPDFLFDVDTAPILKSERTHPIWFGPTATKDITVKWRLPDGWSIADTSLRMLDSCSISRFSMDLHATAATVAYHFLQIDQGNSIPASAVGEAKAYLASLRRARDTHLAVTSD